MQPRVWGPSSLIQYHAGTKTSFPATLGTLALDDADDSAAYIMLAPKTGSISAVGVVVQAITGTPPNYNIALVTVGVDGLPTTTPIGDSTVETFAPGATGYQTVTLDPAAAVTAGNVICIRIWPTVSAPDGSNKVDVAPGLDIFSGAMPWYGQYSTAWQRLSRLNPATVVYSDATWYGLPTTEYWGININSGTDPDEVGMKITLPTATKCCGAQIAAAGYVSSAAWSVCLYNSDSTLLASWTCADEDMLSAENTYYHAFWAEQTLPAGDYYVTVKPSGAANCPVIGFQFPSAALRAGCMLPEADSCIAAYRTDDGEWTTDDTALPFMGLLLSDITFGGDPTPVAIAPRWL